MLHCGGGPGPNSFGQSLPQARPLSNAPEHDILSALERWVEKGVAPGKSITVTSGAASLPLCSYPEYPKYTTGPVNVAASYACSAR